MLTVNHQQSPQFGRLKYRVRQFNNHPARDGNPYVEVLPDKFQTAKAAQAECDRRTAMLSPGTPGYEVVNQYEVVYASGTLRLLNKFGLIKKPDTR